MGSFIQAGTAWAPGSSGMLLGWSLSCSGSGPDPTPCSWDGRIPREDPMGSQPSPWISPWSSPDFSAAQSVSLLCATLGPCRSWDNKTQKAPAHGWLGHPLPSLLLPRGFGGLGAAGTSRVSRAALGSASPELISEGRRDGKSSG